MLYYVLLKWSSEPVAVITANQHKQLHNSETESAKWNQAIIVYIIIIILLFTTVLFLLWHV